MNATERRGAQHSDIELQTEVESCTTIGTIGPAWQRLEDVSRSGNTHEPSAGIVPSMARVDRLFEDVKRTSEPLQSVFSNVADLVPKVQIQQVAFHQYCKMLLVTVAKSSQDVANMIEDRRHPVWRDKIVHRNIDRVMARFYTMSSNVLEKLQESLWSLKVGFRALRGLEKPKTRSSLDRSKPMASSTTEDLPDLVQKLRKYNDIFLTLILQAVPRQSGHKLVSTFAEEVGYPHDVRAASASLPSLDLDYVQRVLQDFYHTRSNWWTCHDAESHSLSLSLKFDHARAGALLPSGDFRFIIAVTSPCFDGPYFLFVDSTSGDSCQMVDTTSKKTCLSNNLNGAAVRTKPLDLSIDKVRDEGGGTLKLPEIMEASKYDLVLAEDLCHCILSLEAEREIGICSLRYLESRSGLKFILSSAFRDENQRQGSHSLDDVLWRASREGRAIPINDRLRTASSLAAGVFHLKTSSWLPQVWSSKDIYYFDVNDYRRCTLGEPFLKTPLDDDRTRRFAVEGTNSTAIHSSILCLGLVLIELAFSAPWQKLQMQEDLTKTLSTPERNLLNMMRLSETVSRELGSRYAKVVQTCLSQGLEEQRTQDLGKTEVDELIFEEVVKELDKCLSVVTSNAVPSSTENHSAENTD